MSSCQADGWSSKGLPSQPQQQLWLADSGCHSCGGVHLKGLGDIKFEGCEESISLAHFVGRVLTWISTVPRLLRGLMEALASLRRAVARMRCISRARTSLICSQSNSTYRRASQQELASCAKTSLLILARDGTRTNGAHSTGG